MQEVESLSALQDLANQVYSDTSGAVDYNAYLEEGNDTVIIVTDKATYKIFHYQDCCEHVYLADMTGDIPGLVGQVIEEAYITDDAEAPSAIHHRLSKGKIRVRFGSEIRIYNDTKDQPDY